MEYPSLSKMEPNLPWIEKLPSSSRFYAVVSAISLLLIIPFLTTQKEFTGIIEYIPLGLLILAFLSLILAFVVNTKEQINKSSIVELEKEIEKIKVSLNPLIRDFDTIRELIIDASASGSSEPNSLLLLAKRQLMNGDHDDSIATLNILANQSQENPRLYSNLSYAYEAKGNFDKAINYINKAIDICLKTEGDKIPRYLFHRCRYWIKKHNSCPSDKNENDYLMKAMQDLKAASKKDASFYQKAVVSEIYKPVIKYLSLENTI